MVNYNVCEFLVNFFHLMHAPINTANLFLAPSHNLLMNSLCNAK
jgi:hypothetical protein